MPPFDKLRKDLDFQVSWVRSVSVRWAGASGAEIWDADLEPGIALELAASCDLQDLELFNVSFEPAHGLLRFAFGREQDEVTTVLYLYPKSPDTSKLIRAASVGYLWVPVEDGVVVVPLGPQTGAQLEAAAYDARYWESKRAGQLN